MIAGKVNLGIVPFRVKVNSITPDAPGFEPVSHSYLRQMFTGEGAGKGNLVDYFLDVSHGKLDISGSTVLPWLDLRSTRSHSSSNTFRSSRLLSTRSRHKAFLLTRLHGQRPVRRTSPSVA